MALTRFLFITSLVLFSLLILASAGDCSYNPSNESDQSKSQDYSDSSKPEGNAYSHEVESYKSKSKSKSVEYNGSDSKSNHDESESNYDESKSEGNSYGRKVDIYKSKSKSVEYNSYDSNSGYGKSKSVEIKKEKSMSVSVEGLVYCKSGSSCYPLQGAVTRVTCASVDEHGYKSRSLTVYSSATDDKGYFSATISSSELMYGYKITDCKAYLEKSSEDTCNVPTDVNYGVSGATLTSYRILKEKNVKLYSVKTFYYTSSSESNSPAPTDYKSPAPTEYKSPAPTGY